MKISEAVANRIKELLKEKKISLYKLQLESGLSKPALRNILNSKYESVNFDTIILISKAFKISLTEFYKSPLFSNSNFN